MTDIDLDLSGVEVVEEQLEDEADNLDQRGGWQVGTAVNYSIFLEYGTSKMDPKPFMRPALREAQADLEAFVASNTNTTVGAIDDVDQLVQTVALALERRIKEIITNKGLIDTGALRASVAAVPQGAPVKGLADVAARADVDLDPEDFDE